MERFYEYFAPTHYDLNLSITSRKTKIHGRVEISGEVKAKTIKLHAVDIEISELVIDDKVTEYEQKFVSQGLPIYRLQAYLKRDKEVT